MPILHKNPASSSKRKAVKRSHWGNALLVFVIAILGVFTALPFIYAISQSLKPLDEIFIFPPRLFVHNPTTENFYQLTQLVQSSWVPFSRYLFNSIFVSVTATVLHVLLSSMAAFPLAKFTFPFSKFISSIIVMSLLFTGEATAIPQFILMSRVNMLDSYWALILPAVASSLGIFLMQQFMRQLPDALIEAANIDGANLFTTLWRVVFPAVKPAWLTLMIFAFQATWNREGTESIYSDTLKVLPTVLKQITSSGLSQAGTASAAAVIIMIPPILVFLCSQSSVIETMAQSGIKE